MMEVSNNIRTVAEFPVPIVGYVVMKALKFFILVPEDFRGDGSLWEIAAWKTNHAENVRLLDQK